MIESADRVDDGFLDADGAAEYLGPMHAASSPLLTWEIANRGRAERNAAA